MGGRFKPNDRPLGQIVMLIILARGDSEFLLESPLEMTLIIIPDFQGDFSDWPTSSKQVCRFL